MKIHISTSLLAIVLAGALTNVTSDSPRKQKSDKSSTGGNTPNTGNKKSKNKHSKDANNADCKKSKKSNKEIINVEYLIIGAGSGGVATAMDFGESLQAIGEMNEGSVLIIEASDRIGGRHEYVEVVSPDGYDGPILRAGLGAQRYDATFKNTRHLVQENEVPSYCSPWNNYIFARGRSARCDRPPADACAIFTDFCSNEPQFIDKTQTETEPYGSAFNLEGIASDNDDPEGAALQFMIGSEITNPATGDVCDNANPNPANMCASEACKHYADYRSFLQGVLGNEYAELISVGNVGFLGDQGSAFNACRMIDWIVREYDTLSVPCYPEGGLQALNDKMLVRAVASGVEIKYNTPAITIDTNVNGQIKYVVDTPNHIINVHKFLFVAINTADIHGKVNGSFVDFLESQEPFQQPKGSAVATVAMQWDPNTPAWFFEELDKTGGSYSLRQFGDLDCFSRAEFIDSPYHRQQNAIRTVFSDFRCIDLWKELIEAADSGNTEPLTNRVLEGLRRAFPNVTIPDPVRIVGKLWETAWYFSEPLNDVTVEELLNFASEPDNGKSACLIGDSYASLYYGWTEGAYISSRKCLSERFSSTLGDQLNQRFIKRDNLIKPFEYGAPNTADYELGEYEYFPPYTCLYKEDGSLKSHFTTGANCGAPDC